MSSLKGPSIFDWTIPLENIDIPRTSQGFELNKFPVMLYSRKSVCASARIIYTSPVAPFTSLSSSLFFFFYLWLFLLFLERFVVNTVWNNILAYDINSRDKGRGHYARVTFA